MKVLFAASEVTPIVKMGGLGDVIGALPKALEKARVDADVIVPFYTSIDVSKFKIIKQYEIEVPYGGKTYVVPIFRTKLPGSLVDVFLVKQDYFFDIQSGHLLDEVTPYSFFNKAVVEFIKTGFNTYNVIHCHDWHTGLIAHLLYDELGSSKPPVVFTIHNISYQGNVDISILKDIDLNPGLHKSIYYDIEDGFLNFMQQGISTADFISTVSPTYANEILFSDIGNNMSHLLYEKRHVLKGVLNGIDYSILPRDFDSTNWRESKLNHKKNLYKKLKIKADLSKPLFAFISRIEPNQKGLDILFDSLDTIVDHNSAFAMLGVGDTVWEDKFKGVSSNNISVNIKFDTSLALEIFSASEFFLVPSRFEPCGLTQMIAMYYGSLPIVRDVGGLKDSVIDSVNGFKFKLYNSTELKNTVNKAKKFYENEKVYNKMVLSALNADFGWQRSAIEYKKIYRKLLEC